LELPKRGYWFGTCQATKEPIFTPFKNLGDQLSFILSRNRGHSKHIDNFLQFNELESLPKIKNFSDNPS
jgi:hypothetical protein